MNDLNVPQFVVTAIAAVLITSPLLLLVFLAGRGSVRTATTLPFDRLTPDYSLGTGSWSVEYDGDNPNSRQVAVLNLHQIRGRVVGVGQSIDGTHHSLEGVLYGRRFCCICIDENPHGFSVATLTAELQPGENQIIGMRSSWSAQTQMLTVRKAVLTRQNS